MINLDTRLLIDIDENELWMLTHLVKFLGKKGAVWPSNKTLCEDTRWHIEKVQRVKKSLIDKGIISCKMNYSTSNTYKFHTKYISIWNGVNGMELEDKESTGKTDRQSIGNSDRESTGKTDNEVLSNEVLSNEVLTKEERALKNFNLKIESFKRSLYPFVEQYGKKMVKDFYEYWSEANDKKTSMRWEIEKRKKGVFEIPKRLASWKKREKEEFAKKVSGAPEKPLSASMPKSYHR